MPTFGAIASLLDLLLPERCAACATPACGLCARCHVQADALRLRSVGFTTLGPGVAAVGAYAYAGVIRDAVRGMKISGRFGAARHLADEVLPRASAPGHFLVTWVPSTPRRLRERGVELPRLLAGPDALPLLRRRRESEDQTSLTPEQRRALPDDTFAATARVPSDVILVDDVRTTGATAQAAASALLAAGANRVIVATLAVGGDEARQTTVPLRHLRAT